MAMGASVIAFLLACVAAGTTLLLGYSFLIAVLTYSGVGAVSLLLAVWIADALTRDAAPVSQGAAQRVAS
ncbi:MAG: hypothetical protein ABJX32_16765 [Tateyamaria sp.]|uniref:hypothetical protein n=1 Tax=Tateyamaria sp. TaxID=1929288 RepID=UPI00329AE9F6